MKTEGYEVFQLEKLYALLCQSIYRHQRDYNKMALIQVSNGTDAVLAFLQDVLTCHRKKIDVKTLVVSSICWLIQSYYPLMGLISSFL